MTQPRTTTWRAELAKVLQEKGESLADLLFATTDPSADPQSALAKLLDTPWERGYGSWAPPFMAWGPAWVYQSANYDGAYRVTCVSRHPPGSTCRLAKASA